MVMRPTLPSDLTTASYLPFSFSSPRTLDTMTSGVKMLTCLWTMSRISEKANSLNVFIRN